MTSDFVSALADARVQRERERPSLPLLFTDHELRRLEEARRSVRSASATIIYCVYENPFAKSGGIFAVADNYCSALARTDRDVFVVTPFHSRLRTRPEGHAVRQVAECDVAFAGDRFNVRILEHLRHDVRWILLSADGFFEADGGSGGTDPYVNSQEPRLLTDSLFLCAAIPEALAALGLSRDLIVHAQDWELASTALTLKLALLDGRLESAAVVLTSHNPYDNALSGESVRLVTDRRYARRPPRTVYECMIPFTDAPVTTVSRNFASELLDDPLQTHHFADHLQDTFKSQGIVGVDNGLFGRPVSPFSEAALRDLEEGRPATILGEKLAKRERMLQVFAEYDDARIMGRLDAGGGRSLVELPDDVPVFLMFGRLDPGQKGFDVLARAIETLPTGPRRFILMPIITGGSSAFQDDLHALASARPGEVVVYPFRMERGYLEAMAGATYAVMPSLYEPFGGATEPYLNGTPVVARATGGLVRQVDDGVSGIAYREAVEGTGAEWKAIQTATTPQARMEVPTYRGMVSALTASLTRAGEIYRMQPETYAAMLGGLLEKAETFSWSRTIREYAAVYELATT